MAKMIEHIDTIETYEPGGHSGTVNKRFISHEDGQGYEMVLGCIQPGGTADRHNHVDAFQVMYVLSGEAAVALGDDSVTRHTAGTIFRIPPGVDHEVSNLGDCDLELMLIYSPPLTRNHSK